MVVIELNKELEGWKLVLDCETCKVIHDSPECSKCQKIFCG